MTIKQSLFFIVGIALIAFIMGMLMRPDVLHKDEKCPAGLSQPLWQEDGRNHLEFTDNNRYRI